MQNVSRVKSFVDDLFMKRGTVSMRVAFVLRSAEVHPLFRDLCAGTSPRANSHPPILTDTNEYYNASCAPMRGFAPRAFGSPTIVSGSHFFCDSSSSAHATTNLVQHHATTNQPRAAPRYNQPTSRSTEQPTTAAKRNLAQHATTNLAQHPARNIQQSTLLVIYTLIL